MLRKATGRRAENLAAAFLKKKGYRIIDRNFACRLGEIDIIAKEEDELVFIEVRSANGSYFYHPLESITGAKIRRLRRLAQVWMSCKRIEKAYPRFDIISIVFLEKSNAEIEHIRDAF